LAYADRAALGCAYDNHHMLQEHIGLSAVTPWYHCTAHQQGNGLAERINQPIESYLRAYVNLEQNNWDEYLDLCEFAWNNSKHAVTGLARFTLIKDIYQIVKL
ncbi:hypothetical protein K3495_g17065, partial [Podosphaera aphanis]